MKTRFLSRFPFPTLIFAGGLVLGATAAQAHPMGEEPPPGFPDEMMMVRAMPPPGMDVGLGLDSTQQARLREIHEAFRPRFDDLGRLLAANRQAFESLDSQAADYLAQAGKLAQERGDLAVAMTQLQAEARMQTDAVLSAGQRQELRRRHDQRREQVRQRLRE